MSKNKSKKKNKAKAKSSDGKTISPPPKPGSPQVKTNGKLKRDFYENEIEQLHVELVHLQEWVRDKGLKIVVLFEGRDAAGKGGRDQTDHRAG